MKKKYKVYEVVVRTDSTTVHTEQRVFTHEEGSELVMTGEGQNQQLVFSTTDKKEAQLFTKFMLLRDQKVFRTGEGAGAHSLMAKIVALDPEYYEGKY